MIGTARLERFDLRVGRPVASGAQGVIHELGGFTLPGIDLPLLYKEFSAGTPVFGAALEALAGFREMASPADRALLDRYTVWPLAVVTDHGPVVGYVMQRIPDRFMQPIATSLGREAIVREVQHLFVADDLAVRNLGEAPTGLERLVLAREMAFAVAFLHSHGLVFGDVSFKNEAFCLRPAPGLMLLDCDAVRRAGQRPAVPQLHSPGWKPPEGGPQNEATDCYKLGLFVLRCLTPGVNAQNRDAAAADPVLDRQGRRLLRRALSESPGERTPATEWVDHLDRALAQAPSIEARTGEAPGPVYSVGRSPARPAHVPPAHAAPAHTAPAHTAPAHAPAATGMAAGGSAPPRTVRALLAGWLAKIGVVKQTPPPQVSVSRPRGRRIHPHKVHTSTGWSAAPAPMPPAVSAAAGQAAAKLGRSFTGGRWIVVIVLAFASFLLLGSLTSNRSNQGRPQSSQFASNLESATRVARAQVGSSLALVSVSTNGEVGGRAPNRYAGRLDEVAPRWVFEFVDPLDGAPAIVIHQVSVDDHGRAVAYTVPGVALAPALRRPMPAGWEADLRAAVSLVAPGRSGLYQEAGWVCDPAGNLPTCVWVFRFYGSQGVGERVFVSSEGTAEVVQPRWYSGL